MSQSIGVYPHDISARLLSGCLTFLAAPFIFVLDDFAKSIVSFVMSVCLSVHVEKIGYHWTDFHEISYLNIRRKSAVKIQLSLKSDKNNGYFT